MSALEHFNGWAWPRGFGAKHGARYLRSRQHVQKFIKEVVPKDRRGVAVQAGGHVGVWPWSLAKHFATVYTFEPEPANFAALVANTHERTNIYAARGVLGCDRGPIHLHYNERNSGGHWMKLQAGTTPVYRVDDLGLAVCDALILDVEGAEALAIAGAEQTIAQHRPILFMEMLGHIEKKLGQGTTDELRAYLGRLGYRYRRTIHYDEVWTCSS